MKKNARSISAFALTVVYLMISISPLVISATGSAKAAHALSGQCSGDCNICGCSPERRASHTCCCALKKRMQQKQDNGKQAATAVNDPANSENGNPRAGCCKNKPSQKKETVLKCNCPCGSSKQLAFSGITKMELLPITFIWKLSSPQENSREQSVHQQLASRDREPPVPPPKLSCIS